MIVWKQDLLFFNNSLLSLSVSVLTSLVSVLILKRNFYTSNFITKIVISHISSGHAKFFSIDQSSATKREVLQQSSRVFDPLGFTSQLKSVLSYCYNSYGRSYHGTFHSHQSINSNGRPSFMIFNICTLFLYLDVTGRME